MNICLHVEVLCVIMLSLLEKLIYWRKTDGK